MCSKLKEGDSKTSECLSKSSEQRLDPVREDVRRIRTQQYERKYDNPKPEKGLQLCRVDHKAQLMQRVTDRRKDNAVTDDVAQDRGGVGHGRSTGGMSMRDVVFVNAAAGVE